MNDKKIKIFTISDHPMSPSGVGTQTKFVIEHLLKTGKYSFLSLGGAVKHQNYNPMKTEQYGDDWIIHPVDGYGNPDIVRSILRAQKPDILWFMTDPRFFTWLWEMEDEIRPHIPMVYYHVWDNYPYPKFNKRFYDSTDVICTISKVTDDIVRTVAPDVECHHIPHCTNMDIFNKKPEEEVEQFRKMALPQTEGKFLFFWNNRNARRKQSGTLIWWFKDFLDKVGHDKAMLLMHTAVDDPNGQDLKAIIHELGLTNGEVMFSPAKIPPEELAKIYNVADCTVNVSDAEGFGLATLESLACETPILVNMTGGLQEQVTDGEKWFGIGIEPSSKAIIGSQQVPFIREDRMNKEDFLEAMLKMYNSSEKQRKKMGSDGRKHLLKNYNHDTMMNKWEEVLDNVYETRGSWAERKQYEPWCLKEL